MHSNKLLDKLSAGEVVVGLCNTYPATGIIEGMCRGWDFVWIDAQHGQHSLESIHHSIQAATVVATDSVLRIPCHSGEMMGPYADLAPSAIMVPMVNNALQASQIVEGLYFPPLGKRSYGGRRMVDLFGRNNHLNKLFVIAQLETPEAVRHAAEIIRTDGIDLLFFGADDMKLFMNIPVNTPVAESAELLEVMRIIAEAARKAGKFSGCVAADPETVRIAVSMGYQFIVAGSDSGFLRGEAAKKLKELQAVYR